MDIKLFFAISASLIFFVSYVPYFRDIFAKKTKPHAYTWLVWAITQGTVAMGVWYGGGKFGFISFAVAVPLVVLVFLFSLHYGTRNITKADTSALVVALLAIVVWWQLRQPLVAVFMVTAIDLIGYFPTFRKSFEEPWSETMSSWTGFIIGNYLTILALDKYNVLTLTYLIAINFANIALVAICLMRRRVIKKPAS